MLGASTMTPLTLDTQKPPVAALAPARLVSLDAYRGLVMFLMMAEVLSFASVAKARPDSALWQFLAHHQTHVEWIGCSLHDLIQPSFSFLVGVALPFSLASRAARGQSRRADDAPRRLAGPGAHPAGRLPAVRRPARRPTGPSRTRSARSAWATFPVPARLPARARAVGRAGADPGRLLGGLRALPAAGAGLRLRQRGRAERPGRT